MKVVVVSTRGLRLGLLGLYGNLWVGTPALDSLAAGAIVFDWHFANRADAAGARRAWRSGRLHLPRSDAGLPAAAEADLIATLRGQGVATCLILDESRPGWPGFDVESEFTAGWGEVHRIGAKGTGSPLDRALDAAAATLERLREHEDWLMWLDLATPLPPWDVPEEFLEPYFAEEPSDDEEEEKDEEGGEEEEEDEPLYPVEDVRPGPIDPGDDQLFLSLHSSCAAAVSYFDAGVGRLLEALAALPGGEEIVVVVTADSGLPLGEHGAVGLVRPEPYDEVIHVPLILRLPGVAPRRVDALTQAADLAPTLAALFDVRLEGAQGQSLLPLAQGEVERLRDYVCAGIEAGGGTGWCLRTEEWEFVLPDATPPEGESRGARLYVKVDDRWEVNDIAQHHLEWLEALEQTLRLYLTASGRPGPFVPPPLPEPESATHEDE
jgi:arylsulfatase A-like enzyme